MSVNENSREPANKIDMSWGELVKAIEASPLKSNLAEVEITTNDTVRVVKVTGFVGGKIVCAE